MVSDTHVKEGNFFLVPIHNMNPNNLCCIYRIIFTKTET